MSTIYMRSKVDAIDYKYFVEPNIPKFKLTDEWLEEIRKSIPELAFDRKNRYMNEYGLSEYDSDILVKEKKVSDFFDDTVMRRRNRRQNGCIQWIPFGHCQCSALSTSLFFLQHFSAQLPEIQCP